MSIAADEVREQLPPPARAVAIRAPGEDRVLGLDRRGVADRAAVGGCGRRRAVLALGHVRWRGEHLRDHVAGPQHDHLLPEADVLAAEVLLVVQGGQLDRDAADVDGLEHRVGVQVAELAGVPADLVELGDRRGGRELPGDRPPRLAPDDPEPPLELDCVDLDHDAVDLEVKRPPPLLPRAALGYDLVLGAELLDVGVDGEAVLAQPLQRVQLGRSRKTTLSGRVWQSLGLPASRA